MKRKKKKNRLLENILIFIIPIILCLMGYYIYDSLKPTDGIPSVNKLIEEKKNINYQDKDNKIDTQQYVNHLPEYREQNGNNDIMGRLEIPNLNIDALITRTVNNQYYLNYSIHREWDQIGVPFFDYRNKNLNTDKQINIYGHNTERTDLYSRLPFTNLEAYVDKNIFDNYKDVYLSIDERQMHYEVVAIKILTDNNPEHMKVAFKSDEDFNNHMNIIMTGLLYKSAEITTKDRVLILQVCHYNPRGSYLLVICKEV